jgi:hypothetical protein
VDTYQILTAEAAAAQREAVNKSEPEGGGVISSWLHKKAISIPVGKTIPGPSWFAALRPGSWLEAAGKFAFSYSSLLTGLITHDDSWHPNRNSLIGALQNGFREGISQIDPDVVRALESTGSTAPAPVMVEFQVRVGSTRPTRHGDDGPSSPRAQVYEVSRPAYHTAVTDVDRTHNRLQVSFGDQEITYVVRLPANEPAVNQVGDADLVSGVCTNPEDLMSHTPNYSGLYGPEYIRQGTMQVPPIGDRSDHMALDSSPLGGANGKHAATIGAATSKETDPDHAGTAFALPAPLPTDDHPDSPTNGKSLATTPDTTGKETDPDHAGITFALPAPLPTDHSDDLMSASTAVADDMDYCPP